jgi:uncharacterized protein
MNKIQQLVNAGLCKPEFDFIPDNLCLLSIGGSRAYNTANENSDVDLWGICIPPDEVIFPYEHGHIYGLGKKPIEYGNWQKHHVFEHEVEYDINIYNIVRLIDLARQGNPNIIDMISIPDEMIQFETEAGKFLRQEKAIFYSKNMYPKFRGFIKNHKLGMLERKTVGRRLGLIDKYGYDVKDAGHCVRCMLGLIDLLTLGEYNIRKHCDLIRDIRNGQYKYKELIEMIEVGEAKLEEAIKTTTLKEEVSEWEAQSVLLDCITLQRKK